MPEGGPIREEEYSVVESSAGQWNSQASVADDNFTSRKKYSGNQ